jgi:hypothetical protein
VLRKISESKKEEFRILIKIKYVVYMSFDIVTILKIGGYDGVGT